MVEAKVGTPCFCKGVRIFLLLKITKSYKVEEKQSPEQVAGSVAENVIITKEEVEVVVTPLSTSTAATSSGTLLKASYSMHLSDPSILRL